MLKRTIPVLSTLSNKFLGYSVLLLCFSQIARSNDALLLEDAVIATVDKESILQSELSEACRQVTLAGNAVDEVAKMELLRDLVVQKLFLAKANTSQIKLPKAAIKREAALTLAAWVRRAGSLEQLALDFNQPIGEIKKELKRKLQEQYWVMLARQSLTKHVVVTPSEVEAYFHNLSSSERTYYPAAFEVRQLVVFPKIALARQEAIKKQLLQWKQLLRDSVVTFEYLAKKCSHDHSSAAQGGEVGWVPFGLLEPSYERAALALKINEVSDPVVSTFGMHLITLIGRNKNQYNTRHILQAIVPTSEEVEQAAFEITEIRDKITSGMVPFHHAVQQYSESNQNAAGEDSVISDNQEYTFEGLLSAEHFPPDVYFAIEGLKVGEVSAPKLIGPVYKQGWRLFYLERKVEPHAMNLLQDYEKIHAHLLHQKRMQAIDAWIQYAKTQFSISFDPAYQAVEGLL